MRVAVVSMDTRGGIQPYIALSSGLRRAGHEVRMIAPSDFATMIAEHGLEFAPLSGSVEAVLRTSLGAAEGGAIASMRLAARELPARLGTWTRETLEACEGVDVLTGGVGGTVIGLSVAEKLGKPFIPTHLQPIGAVTDAYPGVMLARTPRWLGRWGRRVSHRLSEAAIWMPFKGAMNAAREKVLGLSGRPVAAFDVPTLYGFSRHVVQVPPDAQHTRLVTGYWTLDTQASWTPPAGLAQFIGRAGPVVSIGFGSMSSADPRSLTALVRRAARGAGVRAVLLAGWGGLDAIAADDGDDVYCADAIPHDWLFPRVAAVVHHGGAGTTGAGLQAGIPSVVVPFTMDQPFWASRVEALGVGPASIPRSRLTDERLAAALRQCISDHDMRARAAALGEKIRGEDGVREAVAHFERIASQHS